MCPIAIHIIFTTLFLSTGFFLKRKQRSLFPKDPTVWAKGMSKKCHFHKSSNLTLLNSTSALTGGQAQVRGGSGIQCPGLQAGTPPLAAHPNPVVSHPVTPKSSHPSGTSAWHETPCHTFAQPSVVCWQMVNNWLRGRQSFLCSVCTLPQSDSPPRGLLQDTSRTPWRWDGSHKIRSSEQGGGGSGPQLTIPCREKHDRPHFTREDNEAQRAQVHTPRGSDLSLLSHQDSLQGHGLKELAGQMDRDWVGGQSLEGPR